MPIRVQRKYFYIGCAIADVVETVNSKLEKLDNCAILSIDLCKVFDKLDHGIMLNKLEMYGIRGIPLKLIKSYLTNRSQYINIDNKKSS